MSILRTMGLCALLVMMSVAPAAATPAEQLPDPDGLLESAGQAMDRVQAMRFSGPMEINMGSPGSSFAMTMTMSMEGEFQAPDRVRMSMDMGMLGMSIDMVIIGDTAWMRMGSDVPWEAVPMDRSMMPMGSMNFAQQNREYSQFLLNKAVADAGQFYRVSGDLDMAGAISAGSDAASSFMTGGMGGMGGMSSLPAELGGMTAHLTYIIDKSTLYMHGVEMVMAVPTGELGMGDMSMRMNLGISGFNDPSINIAAPM
jgi:hypothetical protein